MQNWPFGSLDPYSFDLIMIDPPWRLETYSDKGKQKAAERHYQTLPISVIRSFPVGDLAAPNSVLWCWGTNPMIDQQIECVKHWGFKFTTMGTWVKTTKGGKIAFGTGYRLRGASEPFIIGTIGNPKTAKNVRSVLMAPIREHSRKPDEAYEIAEKYVLVNNPRRADIFSRQERPGWQGWGDELGKFPS